MQLEYAGGAPGAHQDQDPRPWLCGSGEDLDATPVAPSDAPQPPALPPNLDPAAWGRLPRLPIDLLGLLHRAALQHPPSGSSAVSSTSLFRSTTTTTGPTGLRVTATELRAALADLRHLEGYLVLKAISLPWRGSTRKLLSRSRTPREGASLVADEIEQALGGRA